MGVKIYEFSGKPEVKGILSRGVTVYIVSETAKDVCSRNVKKSLDERKDEEQRRNVILDKRDEWQQYEGKTKVALPHPSMDLLQLPVKPG